MTGMIASSPSWRRHWYGGSVGTVTNLEQYRWTRAATAPFRCWLAWYELSQRMMRRAWGLK